MEEVQLAGEGVKNNMEEVQMAGEGVKKNMKEVQTIPLKKMGFQKFLWNSETGEILGRTPLSWVKIVTFYVVYYTVLALFFMLMMFIFLLTIDNDKPKYIGDMGIIGHSPGVAFRPQEQYMDSSLIWFIEDGEDGYGTSVDWVNRLENHLRPYKVPEWKRNDNIMKECDQQAEFSSDSHSEGACIVNTEALFQGDCRSENGYGFRDGRPCILVKLNKIYDWFPVPYEYINDMPYDIPETVKEAFQKNIDIGWPEANQRVWIECHGKNPADKENIGPIIYYPGMGVGINFFPYLNQMGYLSPPIFIQLQNPTRGVLITVECQAWAHNIDHDRKKMRGMGQFDIMIDY